MTTDEMKADEKVTHAYILKNAEKLESNMTFHATLPVKGLYESGENGSITLSVSKDDVGENTYTVQVYRDTNRKNELGSVSGNLEEILCNLRNGTQELYNEKLPNMTAPLTDIYNYTDVQKFIKEVVENCCDKDGMYEFYFDYRDVLEESTLLEAFQHYQQSTENGSNDYPNFHAYLEEFVCDRWDLSFRAMDEVLTVLKTALQKSPDMQERFDEYIEQFESSYEYLENAGYQGVKFDLNDILGTYQLNLMFATEQEENYDMGSIHNMFYADNIESEEVLQKVNDNALAYLIEQQGYTVKEVVEAFKSEEKVSDSKFINSVVAEASNYFGYMGELTLLASVSGKDTTDLLEAIAKGKGDIDISSYDKNPEINLGIFNEWAGCGSLLELHLEKNVLIPTSMIRNLQVEHAGKDLNHGTTVNSTYGLIGSAWQNVELKQNNDELTWEKEHKKETFLKD